MERVRSTLPSKHTVIHEVLVTYVVRTINEESKEKILIFIILMKISCDRELKSKKREGNMYFQT